MTTPSLRTQQSRKTPDDIHYQTLPGTTSSFEGKGGCLPLLTNNEGEVFLLDILIGSVKIRTFQRFSVVKLYTSDVLQPIKRFRGPDCPTPFPCSQYREVLALIIISYWYRAWPIFIPTTLSMKHLSFRDRAKWQPCDAKPPPPWKSCMHDLFRGTK